MSLKCHLVVQVKHTQEGSFTFSDFKNTAPFLTAHSGIELKQCRSPKRQKKKKKTSCLAHRILTQHKNSVAS